MDKKILKAKNAPLFILFFLIVIWTTINKVEFQLDRISNTAYPKSVKLIPLKPQLIQAYTGTYHFESEEENYTLALYPVGDHLQLLDKDEGDIYKIRATSDTTFIVINEGETFIMRKGEKGNQLLIWNNTYEFRKE